MRYEGLRVAVEAMRAGRNVTAALRELRGSEVNTPEIVEIAYDLQAGAYVRWAKENAALWAAYSAELAEVLHPYARTATSILDAGTGEMTTLSGVAPRAYPHHGRFLACDLSWSRLKTGLRFQETVMRREQRSCLTYFVADISRLPLPDKSIDLVWTSHALEPNRGREHTMLAELMRVTKDRLVLFEPSYERNTPQGRARMDALGYIRDLPAAIETAGGRLEAEIGIKSLSNPLNPTYAYVVKPPAAAVAPVAGSDWACPVTGDAMRNCDQYFLAESGLAYPVLDAIPVLRRDAAILASYLVQVEG